jgi:hypothetical protein
MHKVDEIDNIENDAVIYVMIHLMPYLSSLRPTFYALGTREEAVSVVGTGVELEGAKIS